MLPSRYSFKLVSQSELRAVSGSKKQQVVNTVSVAATQAEQITETDVDTSKRTFLKIAGMAGLGLVASQLLPSKAEALTPSSGVSGVTDSSGVRIDPAKEATSLNIKSATEGTQTNTTTIKTGTDTLVTNSNLMTFTGDRLKATGANVTGLATNDAVVMLRRMVKLMESKATVDSSTRRLITVDAWMENIDGPMDSGTATGTQTTVGLVDTTKYATWIENKWSYYAVKIITGTGLGQTRLITSNTSDTLTLQNAWTTQPDGTSTYGIYNVASIVSDTGVDTGNNSLLTLGDTTKNWTTNIWAGYALRIIGGAEGTQIRLITSNTATVLTYSNPWTIVVGITRNQDSGTATGTQSTTTFTDTSKTWVVNTWSGDVVKITSGTGLGQTRLITSNTSDTLTLQNAWTTQPDGTSTYTINALPIDGNDYGTATGAQTINTLVDDSKSWTTNMWTNYVVKITSGVGADQVRHITSNSATIITLSTDWTTQPDTFSTYAIYPLPARQYMICAVPSLLTDLGTSSIVPRVGLGTDSTIGTVTSITSMDSVGSYVAQQKFGDISHKVYNDAIRSNLTFT